MLRQVALRVGIAALLVLGLSVTEARAGMPALMLDDIAGARLKAISFFLFVFVLVSFCVKCLWKALRRDFPQLPELDMRRALALVALLGLAFNLVLTMISGARELMTPGAWQKNGTTYEVREGAPR